MTQSTKKSGESNANSFHRIAAKSLRKTHTFTRVSIRPLPGPQLPINIRRPRQWVAATLRKDCKIQRPGKEVQVYLRGVQVWLGSGRRVNTQRFGRVTRSIRPFLRGPNPTFRDHSCVWPQSLPPGMDPVGKGQGRRKKKKKEKTKPRRVLETTKSAIKGHTGE